ncbi:MAG TPA: VanW family protein, partial [Polyangiaceae bacterium]|nr:VanW family protein [Polyangiaceae bacterium]
VEAPSDAPTEAEEEAENAAPAGTAAPANTAASEETVAPTSTAASEETAAPEAAVVPEAAASSDARSSRPWRGRWAVLLGAAALGLTTGLLAAYGLSRARSVGQVLPGLRLGGRDLAGLGDAELTARLDRDTTRRQTTSLVLRWGDRSRAVVPAELGFTVPVEPLRARALAIGRDGHPLGNLGHFLAHTTSIVELPFVVRLDGARFDEFVSRLETEALPSRIEPSLRWEKELIVDAGRDGSRIDRRALGSAVRQALERGAPGASIELPLVSEPRAVTSESLAEAQRKAEGLLRAPIRLRAEDGSAHTELGKRQLGSALLSRVEGSTLRVELNDESLGLSLKRFRRSIERPARATSFDVDARGRITVRPPQTGLRVDEPALLAELWAAAARPDREVVVRLRVEEPGGLTEAEASQLGVERLVAQFVTRHPCCEPRVRNIHAVAEKIDGLVLRPGETFSLNQFLGPRSSDEGYVEAPTIVRGKMKATAGGGISQFATTLFNAVFDGGYEIIQRQPHSIWFTRYPEGLEATVSYPSPDLVFKNDTAHGLLIKTRFDDTSIRVLLYGDNEGRRVERHVSRRRALVEPPLEYLADPKLAPDANQLLTRGQSGWTVMTQRVVHYPGGAVSEQGREVTYQPKPMIIAVHPCRIPAGMKGWTGERCPEPEPSEESEPDSDAAPGESDGEPSESDLDR